MIIRMVKVDRYIQETHIIKDTFLKGKSMVMDNIIGTVMNTTMEIFEMMN